MACSRTQPALTCFRNGRPCRCRPFSPAQAREAGAWQPPPVGRGELHRDSLSAYERTSPALAEPKESVPDTFDSATRSRIIARVQSRNTGPQLVLRRALHARGLRYKLHDTALPGQPDLVFPRYRAVCFVHGCFWHRHDGCPRATTPTSNRIHWARKFAANVRRDRAHRATLLDTKWRVAVVWEGVLRPSQRLDEVAGEVQRWLKSEAREFVAE